MNDRIDPSFSRSGGLEAFVVEAPNAMAMFDREMRYLAASAGWLLDNHLADPPIGRSHYDVLPDIDERLRAMHRRCLAGATESAECERFDREDDRAQWLKWDVRPWRDADGAIGGLVVASADITARVEAAAATAAALESMEEGVAAYDADLKLTVINEAAVRLLGLPPGFARPGVSLDTCIRFRAERGDFGPFDGDGAAEARIAELAELFRAAKPRLSTRRLPDGRTIDTRFRPIAGGGGVFVFHDVTERAESEARLAEKTALLETTLATMAEGIVAFDPDLRLIVMNEAARSLLQFPSEYTRPGASFDDCIRFLARRNVFGPLESDAAVDALVSDRSAWFGAAKPRLVTRRVPGGRTIDARFSPTAGGGGMFVFHDVTERAESEARLAEKTALLEATLRNMSEGIAVFGPDLALRLANEPARVLLGAPADAPPSEQTASAIARRRAGSGMVGDVEVEAYVAMREGQIRGGRPIRETQRLADGRLLDIQVNPLPEGGAAYVLKDVTELADREARLAEQNALLEAVLLNMGEGVVVYDADRRLVIDNQVASRLFGFPPGLTRPGTSFDDILRFMAGRGDFGDTDAEAVVAYEIARFEKREAWGDERRVGSGRVVESRFHPIPGGAGVMVFRDVTERAEFTATLAERNRLLEATLIHMGEGIMVVDADNRLLIANTPLLAELLDLPPDVLRPGVGAEDILRMRMGRGDFGDRSPASVIGAREAAFRSGGGYVTTSRTPDGRTIEADLTRLPGGGGVGMYRDVTERRHAEETLRASEEQLRQVLEEAPDAILLYDCDQDRLLAANKAAERLFGVPREDILKVGPLALFASEQPDARPAARTFAEHNRRALAGEQVEYERRVRRPSGEERLCRATLVRLGSTNRILRGSLLDITDRVAAEQKLSEVLRSVVDRQEEARRRIARELHDSLGQYLAAMTMRLAVLEREADNGAAVRSVVADLKGLAATVGNEAHRLAWELRPIALDDLGLGAAVQNYADEWSQTSGVTCDLHLSLTQPRLPSEVETTLYRVLQEALTNVVKHAHARRVGVVVKVSSSELVMIVEDDGAGFDLDRVGATPRLGLRGLHERLAAIHGRLEIESTPGHGTTLMIRVPLAEAAPGARRHEQT